MTTARNEGLLSLKVTVLIAVKNGLNECSRVLLSAHDVNKFKSVAVKNGE